MNRKAANRTYHEAQSNMEMLPNYYGWMYRNISKYLSGTVVEIGCGAGIGFRFHPKAVTKVHAVDYNEELLARIKQNYSNKGITTHNLDLTTDWSELQNVRADAVVMMDVLEHFEDDVDFLKKVNSLLEKGGIAAIKVPAQPQMFGEMDLASGHYRRYDIDGLRQIAAESGFDVKRVFHINKVGALLYRLKRQRKSNFSKSFSPAQLRAANVAMRGFQAADLVLPTGGLSLIAILEKAK